MKKKQNIIIIVLLVIIAFLILSKGSNDPSPTPTTDANITIDDFTLEDETFEAETFEDNTYEHKTEPPETTKKHNGSKVLVAQPLESSSSNGAPQGDLMDFMQYAKSEISFDDKSISDENIGRSYEASADTAYDSITEYIDLLCTKYDFEVIGEPYYQTGTLAMEKKIFFDYALRYTGNNVSLSNRLVSNFSKKNCDLTIYGTLKYGKIEGYFQFDRLLTENDDGFRIGSSEKADTSYLGDSVYEGVYRLSDGRYQTTDGRLTVEEGQTLMISDGEERLLSARYVLNTESEKMNVISENSNKATMQHFYISTAEDWEEGIYPASKFSRGSTNYDNYDRVPSMTWKSMFVNYHDGDYVIPSADFKKTVTNMSFRLMCIDGDIAVFYTCSEYKTAPYIIETFTAVNLDVEETGNASSGGSGSGATGITIRNRCPAMYCNNGSCTFCGGSGMVWRDVGNGRYVSCSYCTVGRCNRCDGDGEIEL